MRRCLETMQKVGSWRHNFPHSVHGVCNGHGDNLCTWGTWRRNMQHPGGGFLSADMNKDVKMTLHGRLSRLVVKIVLQIYRQHVIYKKERPVLYVTLKKALYI